MPDAPDTPPIRWLFDRPQRRRQAFQYWVHDPIAGLLNTSLHHAIKPLPIDACSAFGAMMARLSACRYADSDARARRNWRALRPERSDAASVDAAMQGLWRCVARTMAEFSVLDRLWRAGRIAVEGVENLQSVRAANKPVLLACLHLGNWETIPLPCIGMGYQVSGLYDPPKNRFDHRIAVNSRERYGITLYPPGPGAMRGAMRTLTEKEGLFIIFIDEFLHDRVFAPAFGRPLLTEGNIAFVARLARITGAEIVPAYCIRIEDQARFRVTFRPPIALVRDGDRDAALTTNVDRINAAIEPIVREHLDQWYYLLDFTLEASARY